MNLPQRLILEGNGRNQTSVMMLNETNYYDIGDLQIHQTIPVGLDLKSNEIILRKNNLSKIVDYLQENTPTDLILADTGLHRTTIRIIKNDPDYNDDIIQFYQTTPDAQSNEIIIKENNTNKLINYLQDVIDINETIKYKMNNYLEITSLSSDNQHKTKMYFPIGKNMTPKDLNDDILAHMKDANIKCDDRLTIRYKNSNNNIKYDDLTSLH